MTELTRSLDAANATAFIPSIWSTIVVDNYIAEAVISDRVDRRFENDLKYGATVVSGTITEVAPIARLANTDYVYNTVVETNVNVTVNQDYYIFRMIEPMTVKQSIVDLITQYAKIDGKSMAKKIDQTLAALIDTLHGSSRKGTIAVDVEDDNLIDCVTALNINSVPEEDRSWIISSETWGSLMKIDKFVRLDYVKPDGDSAIMRAKLNYPIYGASVFVSNALEENAGNHNNVYMQREAIRLLVQQEPKVVKAYDVRRGCDTLAIEAMWGCAEAREYSGICLYGK
uniref:Putative capsid protein n=1 Tax=viral metagenome TaxID=1070528 RepID=A0A6M3ILE1_9ZZZZ